MIAKQEPLFADGSDVHVSVGPSMTGRQEFMYKQQEALVQKMHGSVADWKVPELPQLDNFKEVIIDLESTGLRWWDGDRLVGAGLWLPDGSTRYLPIRHKVGPNIPEGQFFEWIGRELRGKRIVNIRTKYDLHLFRQEGIDLEAQGNTFGDVAHQAALLDDHRIKFNQEELAEEFLGAEWQGKVRAAHGYELDPTKFREYPAGLVAPRAEGDVATVAALQKVFWPMLTAQDLHTVREIEDGVIPVVVEMEENGAPLDMETLARWVKESQAELEDVMWQIKRATGCNLRTPNNRDDITRIFNTLRIQVPLVCSNDRCEKHITVGTKCPDCQVDGKPSFADGLLVGIPHPAIQLLRHGIQLASLKSKFLDKYYKSCQRDGILRYELHQLPFQRDDEGGGGAVSGRFSSAAPNREEGANIQQVIGVKKQKEGFTGKYIVKNLFKPSKGCWYKADASQFQFRLFAHYANSPGIIEAYQRDNAWREMDARAEELLREGLPLTKADKLTDFHEAVQDLILEKAHKELNRTHTKNVNFAQVFGAGIDKMAAQLGVPREIAQDISETYHKMFPEVKPLLQLTSHLAMPGHREGTQTLGKFRNRGCGPSAPQGSGGQCARFYRQGYEHRGWVKTYLGRRARFGHHDRFYSALNRIIQGTEGDINKRIMIEVHKVRHELGITERFTVHDELSGDLHDPAGKTKLKEILNTQYYDFRVPILWEVAIGPSWGEAK